MPRTRQVVKNQDVTHKESLLPEKRELPVEMFQTYKEIYEKTRQELVNQKKIQIVNIKLMMKQTRLAIPITARNKTSKELREKKMNWNTISSLNHCSVLNSIVHTEDPYVKKKSSDDGGRRKTRSSSRTRSSSSGSNRTSRSMMRNIPSVTSTAIKSNRKSRSASRTNTISRKIQNKFTTPINNKKLENFGMVTPKMKPNTPSVVLRRPQQGEIAISLSGSPLMTTAMVSETTANVNIPLADGRMINIQPMRGIRQSQIPDLDPEIQKQLRTLRDNLDKVCQYSKIK
ncbi:borealin isoform X2 [Harmonia axyridis]|uniref:borealin isoform X2 n=1 Tax=Harmonia axyridis TaxID=115357 RepID=UPI001E27611D|nr:borealin isoform X2 [Harmonia axyridis]